MNGYGSRFIGATFGLPVSALHYWDRTGLIKPSVRPAAGRGSKRLYSFRDLVQLLVVSRLRALGLSLQRIRKCLDFLRQRFPHLDAPLAELSLVTDGETVFLLTDEPDKVLDTLRQQLVWSVPIAAWVQSTRETINAATSPRAEKIVAAGREYTIIMEQDPEDGWWVGLVKELPGCGSQGGSLDELREMVADAIREYLIARGDLATDAQAA
jgi:DNA-binding transcriptional MerR regulator